MPNNWKTYKLNEICDLIVDCPHSTPKWKDNGVTVLRSNNIRNGKLNFAKQSYTDEEHYHLRTRRAVPSSGDLVITREAPMGEVCMLPEGLKCCLGQRMVLIRPSSMVDNAFLLYAIQAKEVQNQIMIYEGTGSTVSNLRIPVLESLNIPFPPLPEQRAIASILSSLDDKIELNLQMNKTLEEMAMTLYKHWFVDFGPFKDGKFIDSELGLIPERWEVKRLQQFVELTMGQSPKSEFYNDNREGLPFHQGVSHYGIRFPKDVTYSTSGNREAIEGDILFSVRAPVGRMNITKNRIILGRGLASMRMRGNNNFLFYTLKNMFANEDIIGSGTVFNSVNKTDLQNLEFVIPPNAQLAKFQERIVPLDNAYSNNSKENQTLTTLRDTLLPKLISGEVRVKDVKQTLAEVL